MLINTGLGRRSRLGLLGLELLDTGPPLAGFAHAADARDHGRRNGVLVRLVLRLALALALHGRRNGVLVRLGLRLALEGRRYGGLGRLVLRHAMLKASRGGY